MLSIKFILFIIKLYIKTYNFDYFSRRLFCRNYPLKSLSFKGLQKDSKQLAKGRQKYVYHQSYPYASQGEEGVRTTQGRPEDFGKPDALTFPRT